MARSSWWLKFGLLGLLLSVAVSKPVWAEEEADSGVEDDEYADSERAHLVVRKFVKDDLVVQGKNVTVTVDVYNAGISSASSVKLTDELPADATLVEGSLTAELGKIGVGSHVKHAYTVVFNTGSMQLTLPAAEVSYIAEADSETAQSGLSSTMTIYVMTPVQQIQRYALKAGAYASLGFARTPSEWRNLAIVVGLVGGLLGANWAVKKVGTARVNSKREKALKELQKND